MELLDAHALLSGVLGSVELALGAAWAGAVLFSLLYWRL
jgi:hypothetical protein